MFRKFNLRRKRKLWKGLRDELSRVPFNLNENFYMCPNLKYKFKTIFNSGIIAEMLQEIRKDCHGYPLYNLYINNLMGRYIEANTVNMLRLDYIDDKINKINEELCEVFI